MEASCNLNKANNTGLTRRNRRRSTIRRSVVVHTRLVATWPFGKRLVALVRWDVVRRHRDSCISFVMDISAVINFVAPEMARYKDRYLW
jgi:hypothetical protein